MDVALDGVTESNIVQISPNWNWIAAATIIGPQSGGNHHRLWSIDGYNMLLRRDSFDEGQTWTITNMGTIGSHGYRLWIAGAFWEPCLYKLDGDMNGDCRVDFIDFALLARNWLIDCGTEPNNPACTPK
jgi:hypothetical protein